MCKFVCDFLFIAQKSKIFTWKKVINYNTQIQEKNYCILKVKFILSYTIESSSNFEINMQQHWIFHSLSIKFNKLEKKENATLRHRWKEHRHSIQIDQAVVTRRAKTELNSNNRKVSRLQIFFRIIGPLWWTTTKAQIYARQQRGGTWNVVYLPSSHNADLLLRFRFFSTITRSSYGIWWSIWILRIAEHITSGTCLQNIQQATYPSSYTAIQHGRFKATW